MAKRKKQGELPGLERPSNKEIDAAAENYVEARDKRMKLTEMEVEAKDALIEVMRKHKLNVYRDDAADPPLVVTLAEGKPSVKVTRAEEDESEEQEEPEPLN